MLFLSVAWGLAATTTTFGKLISKVSATTAHQFMSTFGLLLLAVHMGLLIVDEYMPFSVSELTIPMRSEYRPVAVAFGILAMYLSVFVVVTSWLRKPIGTKWWRRMHLLAVPSFALALVHGVFAGTDTVRSVMWWTYLGTGVIVVFLVLVRGLTAGYRPVRAAHPAARRAAGEHARPGPAEAELGGNAATSR